MMRITPHTQRLTRLIGVCLSLLSVTAQAGYLVSDPGSVLELNNLGAGTRMMDKEITVMNGALLDVNSIGGGGFTIDPAATIIIDGVASMADVDTGTGGALNLAGKVTLKNGGQLNVANGVDVAAGGELAGQGIINAAVSNGGTMSAGTQNGTATTGSLTINGNYTQLTQGVLNIRIAGPLPADADQLVVNGDIAAAGGVTITFIINYEPAPSDSFDVIDATGSTTGEFVATITNPPPGVAASATISADGVTTLVASPTQIPSMPVASLLFAALLFALSGVWFSQRKSLSTA